MQEDDDLGGLWTDDEMAWARDCFAAGDSVAEIASTAGRPFEDVALKLRVWGFVPVERRWSSARRGRGLSPWVGGMLREVALHRRAKGEEVAALAAEARVVLNTMHVAVQAATRQLPWKPRRQRKAA